MICPKCQKDIPIIGAVACPYCAANLSLSSAEIAKILGLMGEENQVEKIEAYKIKVWEVSRLIESSGSQPVRKAYYEAMLADIERAARVLGLASNAIESKSMESSSSRIQQYPTNYDSTMNLQEVSAVPGNEKLSSQAGPKAKGRAAEMPNQPSALTFFSKHRESIKNMLGAFFWILIGYIAYVTYDDINRKRIACFLGFEGSCSSLGKLYYQSATSPAEKRKAQEYLEKGCKNKEETGCQQLEKMKAKGEYSLDTSKVAMVPATTSKHPKKFCETPGLDACKAAERVLELVTLLDAFKIKLQNILVDLESAKNLDEFEVALYAFSNYRQSIETSLAEWGKKNASSMDTRARREAEDMINDFTEALTKITTNDRKRMEAAFDSSKKFGKDPRYGEKMLKWMESPELRGFWDNRP